MHKNKCRNFILLCTALAMISIMLACTPAPATPATGPSKDKVQEQVGNQKPNGNRQGQAVKSKDSVQGNIINKNGQLSENRKKQLNTKSNSSQANLDSVNVYESDIPISQLLQQYAGSGLLGRPTDKSVTVNIIAPIGMQAFVEYGTVSGDYAGNSDILKSSNGKPIEITLSNLNANTQYYYRINYQLTGSTSFITGKEHFFVTQRPIGATFTFNLQADPHMDGHSDANLYRTTLQKESADNPDFIIDLGDAFMTEKFAATREQVERRYLELRTYYEIPGSSAPLFLVNGNHEGEFGWLFNSENKDNDAYWSLDVRKAYYPNPYPDNFYSGSSILDNLAGLHENYYAWKWGDALFIVLDPYSYTLSTQKQNGDMWGWTIGDLQYQWFKQTLENSTSNYKFVFMHHMLGECRGMTTLANLYEWGGYSKNGVWEFNSKRPGWELPIHQLMVKNHVTVFFQGHDHLFCKEEKDGIIYQEVPQPSTLHGDAAPGTEGQYTGQVIDSSGYMRIRVTPQGIDVEYIRTAPIESSGIAYSYHID